MCHSYCKILLLYMLLIQHINHRPNFDSKPTLWNNFHGNRVWIIVSSVQCPLTLFSGFFETIFPDAQDSLVRIRQQKLSEAKEYQHESIGNIFDSPVAGCFFPLLQYTKTRRSEKRSKLIYKTAATSSIPFSML